MENASKALIIAGAILVAILIISLCIIIYNSNSGITGEQKDLYNTSSVETFNSQFSKYGGNSVKGSEVKQLLEQCIAYFGKGETYNIKIYGDGHLINKISENRVEAGKHNQVQSNINYVSKYKNDIETENIYSVIFNYSNEGKISEIRIGLEQDINP